MLRIAWGSSEVAVADDEVVTIGSDASSDFVVPNATISRRHAIVRRNDEGWFLEDLGSANGTWLGGERINRAVVNSSLEVRLGDMTAGETVTLQCAPDSASWPPPPVDPKEDATTSAPPVTSTTGEIIRCLRCERLHSPGTDWCECGAYLPHESERVVGRAGVVLALDATDLS